MVSNNKKNEIVAIIEQSKLKVEKINDYKKIMNAIVENLPKWEETANSIVVADHEDTQNMEVARELRLEIKNERVSAEKFLDTKRKDVQELMSEYKNEDTLLLKIKQTFSEKSKEIETSLLDKEKTAERYLEKLKQEETERRLEILRKYVNNPEDYKPADMTEEVFNMTIETLERKEKERIEEAKREAEEAEKQRLIEIKHDERKAQCNEYSYLARVYPDKFKEQIDLKNISDEEFDKIYNELKQLHKEHQSKVEEQMLEMERQKKQQAEEARRQEEERKKLQEEYERLEAEKRKAQEEEARRQEEEEARRQEEERRKANAPDKDKLIAIIETLDLEAVELSTKQAIEIHNEIVAGLVKYKARAFEKINKL